MKIVLFLVLAVGLLLLVSAVYTFVVACVRTKDRPWLDPEALKGTSLERFSEMIQGAQSWLSQNNAQEVWITNREGLKLQGIWVPAQNPKGTVLLCHGYRSSMLLDFARIMKPYHDMGLNLLMPRQRAHGKSQGKYITFGVKESGDMLEWLVYHNQQLCNCPVILSGMSMGASTVLFMADEPLPDNVRGIIADCGFSSPGAILSKVFRSVTKLPPQPVIGLVGVLTRLFAGFGLWQKDSRRTLANTHLPVMLVHGTGDDFVPCEMTKEAFEACKSEKTVLLAEGAEHGLSFLKEPERYKRMLLEFLKKHLEGFA